MTLRRALRTALEIDTGVVELPLYPRDELFTRVKKRLCGELLISSALSPLLNLAFDRAVVDSNLPKVALLSVGTSMLMMPLLLTTNLP